MIQQVVKVEGDNTEVGIEGTVVEIGNIEVSYHKNFASLVTKMGFVAGVPMFSKAQVRSIFFLVVHMIDIVHWDLVPYLFLKDAKVFWGKPSKVIQFDLFQLLLRKQT